MLLYEINFIDFVARFSWIVPLACFETSFSCSMTGDTMLNLLRIFNLLLLSLSQLQALNFKLSIELVGKFAASHIELTESMPQRRVGIVVRPQGK